MKNCTQSKAEKAKDSDLFDLAPVGYFILDRDGLIADVNLEGAAILGADKDSLVKRDFSDYVSREGRDEYHLHRKRVLETGARQKCELKLRKEDGTEFYAQMISTALVDEQRKPDKLLSAVIDIAKHKRTEECLQESRQRYRYLVEATTDWIWEVDAKGVYTYSSPKVEELLGYKIDEVKGKTPFDFMPEEEAERLRDFFKEKSAKGESFYDIENTNRHKDGHFIVLETSGIPIFDAEGQLSGYRGIDRDITERKKVEQEIRQQKEFFETAINSLTHPFYVIDVADYTIKMANMAANFGDLSEGLTCYTITHQRDEPCSGIHVCPLEKVKETKEPVTVEHIHYDKDGGSRTVEVHAFPVLDANGDVALMIEYCLDISKRKQAEEALKKAHHELEARVEQRTAELSKANEQLTREVAERKKAEKQLAQKQRNLEAICEAAPFGIILANKDVIIEHTNSVLARLVGKDSSAIIGKPPGDGLGCIHVYDDMEVCGDGSLCHLCQIRGTIEQVLTSGQPVSGVETRSTFLIGGEEISRWLEISASPVMIDNSEHVVLAMNDITSRKDSQAKLDAAQHKLLETAHRAGMAEVATDVLHNVGNVLNSITVSTTAIIGKVTNSEIANLQRAVDIVNDNMANIGTFLPKDSQGKHIPAYLLEIAKHLHSERTDIIGKLRTLADNVEYIRDIVTTQQSYAKAFGVEVQVSIAELVEDAIHINSASLQRHGIQVMREFERLPEIMTDKQKVLQILVNLLSNAKYALIDSKKEEKLLTVRILKQAEDQIRIEVADNGIGISKNNLTRIFSHGYTTKDYGHGFGLHSSALAAKGIGGTLTVHSDGRGRGATFTLGLHVKPVESLR